jgi:hypothetical protein
VNEKNKKKLLSSSFSLCELGQMVGVGMLATPPATAQSGWVGIGLLCFCGFLSWVSANLLGAVMLEMGEEKVKDYASVGQVAFGKTGYVVALLGQYSLLAGAATIFLILMGRFLNGIICEAPQRFFTIVVSVFTYGVVILMPAFKKAKPIAFFAVASMWASVVMIVTLSMIYYGRRECRSDPLDHITCITNIALPTIGSVRTFFFLFFLFLFLFLF